MIITFYYYTIHLFQVWAVQTSLFTAGFFPNPAKSSGRPLVPEPLLIIKSVCRRWCERGQLSLWHLGVVLALWDWFFWGPTRLGRVSTLLSRSLGVSQLLRLTRPFPQSNFHAVETLPPYLSPPVRWAGHYKGVSWWARWRCWLFLPLFTSCRSARAGGTGS